jgi:hypothetical protein
MPTRDEYAKQPLEQRLQRLERTPEELAALIHGRSDGVLSRRPDGKNWAAKEIVCHLRDIEELFMVRFQTMLAMDEPKFLVLGAMPPNPAEWGIGGRVRPAIDPDRWAEERQYLRHDTGDALVAFRSRREESLAFLRQLTPALWQRGSVHVTLGRLTYGDWVALMAAHDDNHLNQLKRALEGRA